MEILLTHREASLNPSSKELAEVIISRIGLEPRKKGSTDKMYAILLALYERSKVAGRDKKPEAALMTVEEMAIYSGISRQTMYSYLERWLILDFIIKTSYIKDGKVIVGYKLNGPTIDSAFEKTVQKINSNLIVTQNYIKELQRIVKNEKISKSASKPQEKSIKETKTEDKQIKEINIEEKEEKGIIQAPIDRPLE